MLDGSSQLAPGHYNCPNRSTVLFTNLREWRIEQMHYLILEAYDRLPGLNVNHRDGDQLNNMCSNPRWATKLLSGGKAMAEARLTPLPRQT